MRKLLIGALVAGFAVVSAWQGPAPKSTETVARPRKKANPDAPEEKPPEEKRKVESVFKKRADGELPIGLPTFRSDVSTVQVDVSVLDKNGRFIPNIPRGNFRVLEDGIPQAVSGYTLGEAPMTVCMVIEFSNLFQQYWSNVSLLNVSMPLAIKTMAFRPSISLIRSAVSVSAS